MIIDFIDISSLSNFNNFFLLQPLPNPVANYILKGCKNLVYLCGPCNIKIPCQLEVNKKNPTQLQIGRGWATYCAANKIVNGDIITFKCAYNMSINCIVVEKNN
jgi:hypothetical protein